MNLIYLIEMVAKIFYYLYTQSTTVSVNVSDFCAII